MQMPISAAEEHAPQASHMRLWLCVAQKVAMQPGGKDTAGDASSGAARQEARRCFAAAAGALAVLPMRNLLGCEVPEVVMPVCKLLRSGNLKIATASFRGSPLSEVAFT